MNSALLRFVELLDMYIAALRGHLAETPLPDPQVLELIPASQLAMRNSADVVYAMLSLYQGNLPAANAILPETIRRDLAAGGTTAIPVAGSFLARIRILQGKLSEAAALCREYIQTINTRGRDAFYLPGNLYISLGEVLRERYELEEAETIIREGIRLNLPWNIPAANAVGYTSLARLELAKHDPEASARHLEQVGQFIVGRIIPPDTALEFRALRASVLVRLGRLEEAQACLETGPDQRLTPFLAEIVQTAQARIYLAQKKFTPALALLDGLEQQTASNGWTGRLINVLLLKSAGQWSGGTSGEALQTFERCLEKAQPEGYLAAFIEMGDPLPAILQAYLRQPGARQSAYAARIGAALGLTSRLSIPQNSELVEALTAREYEVLQRIARGDSNQSIADQLVISLSAVKKHNGNIFGKLGVNSRTQAILRARQLGLLPPD